MNNRKYGCMSLLLDIVMLCITSGLWLIWILFREIRYSRQR